MTQVIWVINGIDTTDQYIRTIHYSVIANDEIEEAEIYHSTDIVEQQIDKNTSNQELIILLKDILQEQVAILEQQASDRLNELKEHIR